MSRILVANLIFNETKHKQRRLNQPAENQWKRWRWKKNRFNFFILIGLDKGNKELKSITHHRRLFTQMRRSKTNVCFVLKSKRLILALLSLRSLCAFVTDVAFRLLQLRNCLWLWKLLWFLCVDSFPVFRSSTNSFLSMCASDGHNDAMALILLAYRFMCRHSDDNNRQRQQERTLKRTN